MRTWKVTRVPLRRTGERVAESELSASACSRIVARGINVFHSGHVEVSVKTSQTRVDGAAIKMELPTWKTASPTAMPGVGRVEFLGSSSVVIVKEIDWS